MALLEQKAGKEHMRDPERIDVVLNEIRDIWKKHPNWRLGQPIVNLSRSAGKNDPFFLEDDALMEVVKEWR